MTAPRKTKPSRWASLPSEAVHPEAVELDAMPPPALLALMSREDHRVVEAVSREASPIARAAAKLARVLSAGGRAFFVGAGTSGRLGVLEAAECPPTFGTEPNQIVAVMAGGDKAVFRSKEGAEDRTNEARELVRRHRVSKRDLVLGISASSVTPFVRSALGEARRRGASTVLVTAGVRARKVADIVVAPRVGPEVLSGSTRLKAGTAAKLVLNRITLLAMIRLGKVYGPYMVDLKPSSSKLRDRAARIVRAITGVDARRAEALWRAAGGEVKTAVVMARLGVSRVAARKFLREKHGSLRAVLER